MYIYYSQSACINMTASRKRKNNVKFPVQSFPKEGQNGFNCFSRSPGSRSCDPGSCQTSTMVLTIKWSQNLDQGFQKKLMNPFCVSFGRACRMWDRSCVHQLEHVLCEEMIITRRLSISARTNSYRHADIYCLLVITYFNPLFPSNKQKHMPCGRKNRSRHIWTYKCCSS